MTAEIEPSALSRDPPRLRSLLSRIHAFEWIAALSLVAMATFFIAGPVVTQYFLLAYLTFRKMVVIALLSVVIIVAIAVLRGLRRRSGWREAFTTSEMAERSFWTDLLRIIASFSVIQTSHLTLKVYVPVINSANCDSALRRLDAALGFGRDPVQLVLDLITHSTVLRVFDFIYSQLYFILLWGGFVVFFALLKGPKRIVFFSSFVIMWQLGLLLYILAPSWGPVFVTPDQFEHTLQDFPATVTVQQGLYHETSSIVRGDYNVVVHFFGLAAFPSLHVAVFVLYALWARQVGRFWFVWNIVFGTIILIGSMLTGYHYLVDGLGGGIVAAFAYVVARRSGPQGQS
jgi:hypothetical protein